MAPKDDEGQDRLKMNAWQAVYEAVAKIPPGRVATYGQISRLLGERLSAQAIGWALHRCPPNVPWHRVVNASGGFSTDRLPHIPAGLQKALLAAEGVAFRPNGSVDLEACRWEPQAFS
jgi:methylated-DNA-protein-cysteine methyltransferase related protein